MQFYQWNGLALTHKSFESDLAFGPDSSNENFYRLTVDAQNVSSLFKKLSSHYRLLLNHQNWLMPDYSLVLAGGVAAILAYEQTGTGKTYFMTSLEFSIARALLASCWSWVQNEEGNIRLTCQFITVIVKATNDVLTLSRNH